MSDSDPEDPLPGSSAEQNVDNQFPRDSRASNRKIPSLPSVHDQRSIHPSATPLGTLSSARRPPAASGSSSDFMAKAKLYATSRNSPRSDNNSDPSHAKGQPASPSPPSLPSSMNRAPNLRLPPHMVRPSPVASPSAPAVPTTADRHSGGPALQLGGLAKRRGLKMSLDAMSPSSSTPDTPVPPSAIEPEDSSAPPSTQPMGSQLDEFRKYINTDKGWITFQGKATITRTGVHFSDGETFVMSLSQVEPLGILGKGNYGTVYKVRHAKPKVPRSGPGLTGFKPTLSHAQSDPTNYRVSTAPNKGDQLSGVTMAMKEIRLELDESKFTTILRELVILHECVSPYIIDFYGAFYQDGAVYMCIEYMDGGSIDKLYHRGVPENVLRKITYATVMGLKTLKDDHNIIHRDVKPTNILVNSRGQVKICDFGVSGNLVASIARTNIGCQSYMAPERIAGGGMTQGGGGATGTYSVQSDIWSLGLTVIECAKGRYPYPPEVSSTIFGQLSAIVEGDPPDLPEEGFSEEARDFVRSCLRKKPMLRPTYALLLDHPWLLSLQEPQASTLPDELTQNETDTTTTSDAIEEDSRENSDSLDKMDEDEKMIEDEPPQMDHAKLATNFRKLRISTHVVDEEVADWVKAVLQDKNNRKAEGTPGSNDEETDDGSLRPALHKAPLDSASPTSSMVN